MPITTDPKLMEELRSHYLFAGLEETQLQQVLGATQHYTVAPEETLFEQGVPADRFFLLRRGLFKLSRLSPGGDEKVIELLRPGQTFAEALMFAGRPVPYPVTARAIEASEVLGFENRVFLGQLRESPDTCLRLLSGMSKRVHGLLTEIDRLALQSATSRVAGFLIQSAEEGKVALRMPKHVLASHLSIKPETLSRIFARLISDGLIAVHGAEIDVCRPDDLRRMIEAIEP